MMLIGGKESHVFPFFWVNFLPLEREKTSVAMKDLGECIMWFLDVIACAGTFLFNPHIEEKSPQIVVH